MEKPVQQLETVLKVYRKTIAYELMNCKVNEDGTCTWYHSDRYMEENPNSKREVNMDELLEKLLKK